LSFLVHPKHDGAGHYPTRAERSADLWVHVVGLSAGAVGGLTLTVMALCFGHVAQAGAVAIYTACLIMMFVCSLAYNLTNGRRKSVLRRLDHAAIFLMIAGSYTPFTTQSLTGGWAIGMTLAVWSLALAGVAGKLWLPQLPKAMWIVLYLALGWLSLIAVQPLYARVPLLGLVLIASGGIVYTVGVIFYLAHRLKFRRAIWHGFVVAAAATHLMAILTGVVLPMAAS
jgi:hemolysin III